MGHRWGRLLDAVDSAYSLLEKHVKWENGPGLNLQLNRRFN